MPSMERAIKSSRNLIRHCRMVYRKAATSSDATVEELQNLKELSERWCKNQIMFVDEMWKLMSPWTSLLEPIFALKQFHSAPSYTQNTLSNEWVSPAEADLERQKHIRRRTKNYSPFREKHKHFLLSIADAC